MAVGPALSVVCDDCGLVFSNPQPTPGELTRFYSPTGEWGLRRVGGAGNTGEPGDATHGRSWSKAFDPIRESVTTPPRGAKVLDFGCGNGELLDALQECGWDTWGIETAVDDSFPRHHRLDAVPDTPVFDLIVANHVLEHVTDPLGLLRQFARAGRIGGYLVGGRASVRHAADSSRLQVRHQRTRARDRVHLAMPPEFVGACGVEASRPSA